ncbi:MAG: pyridoxamine 5'-phosphate oxidase family protein [Planctomycetota bacterium]|nr:pyridoxamine 5'-phosphate oxidase family protein [Planctomycetota bacterium]
MDLHDDWPRIRGHFRGLTACSIATVDADGSPRVTPIGSLFLRGDCTGFFLERFTCAMPTNLDRDPRLCVMGLRTGTWTWLCALARGSFREYPAMRLFGVAGPRREARPEELARFARKVRLATPLRGHRALWRGFSHVRDLTFERAEGVNLGTMTAGLGPR